MDTFLKAMETYGIPAVYLVLSLIAVVALWRELRRKDKEYKKELKETYTQLNDRSKEFAETLNRFMNMFGGHGGGGGNQP